MFETIAAPAALVLLWLLMARFGYDSRERLRSPEARLAERGFTWAALADPVDTPGPEIGGLRV